MSNEANMPPPKPKTKDYKYEMVTFVPSPAQNGEFCPRIAVHNPDTTTTTTTEEDDDKASSSSTPIRPFRAEDMTRVLDYDNMPEPPPPDAMIGHLEFEFDDDDTILDQAPPKFPKRYCCLRGSYVFYFDAEDVVLEGRDSSGGGDGGTDGFSQYANPFLGPPKGVIPLERTVVEIPPGGRRVFREHAQTDARNGYQMVIRHNVRERGGGEGKSGSSGGTRSKRRAPAYLVFDGVGQRDFWVKAIRIRADVYKKDTKLRPSEDVGMGMGMGMGGSYAAATGVGAVGVGMGQRDGQRPNIGGRVRGLRRDTSHQNLSSLPGVEGGTGGDVGPASTAGGGATRGSISVLAGVMETEEQKDVEEALAEFGNKTVFDEVEWVQSFFTNHDEHESFAEQSTLERWQSSIKKGLRGAVLEQYEYFVEASREMTVMGREVMSLKELVGKQVDTIEAMKNVDFQLDFVDRRLDNDGDYDRDDDTDGSSEMDQSSSRRGGAPMGVHDDEDKAFLDKSADTIDSSDSYSWDVPKNKNRRRHNKHSKGATSGTTTTSGSSGKKDSTQDAASFQVEVPAWLEDATEEISAFIKECRYADAAELLFKAKTEASEILHMHKKLSEKKLAKKQLATMERILRSVDTCTDRMCNRLSEGLRRKNEALKQAAKKERTDPLSALAPLVSPIALNDDATSLQLLVKLGRAQDAATAYSARRSLLLTECLHERPICDTSTTNNMDVVIYAAQLSQSFFSCLATSVEGFLDLFLGGQSAKDDISESSSTILSGPIQQQKVVPAGALAAVALWCDSELNKFCATFAFKVLGNLALSPPARNGNKRENSISSKITEFENAADISYLKNQLRSAEEMGEYIVAGKLRKRIAAQENEKKSKDGSTSTKPVTPKSLEGKNRKLAISIAAKCVDQALEFSNECLNSIGLPLTPRLAEYMRPRLRGTEAEIALELELRWDHVVFDWKDDTSHETATSGRQRTSSVRSSTSHDSH